MSAEARYFSMLGPPASGKGTQGRMLAEGREIAYLSTGAHLRREIEKGSELGARAKGFLDRNQYVPDELAVELVKTWVVENPGGWVLDGFPRSVPQAEALLQFVPQPVTIIHLPVPAEELRRRVVTRRECLACGLVSTSEFVECPQCGGELEARADDSSEGFRLRFQAYEELTLPALAWLQERTKVLTVVGLGSRDDIAASIREGLD